MVISSLSTMDTMKHLWELFRNLRSQVGQQQPHGCNGALFDLLKDQNNQSFDLIILHFSSLNDEHYIIGSKLVNVGEENILWVKKKRR